jgi:hypothetical protein
MLANKKKGFTFNDDWKGMLKYNAMTYTKIQDTIIAEVESGDGVVKHSKDAEYAFSEVLEDIRKVKVRVCEYEDSRA